MGNDNKFKSTLVVWYGQELPVIETFYAGSVEEIQTLQEAWMNDNGYAKANMHLYELKDGNWQSMQQCEFCCTPSMPDFVFLQCSPHEDKSVREFVDSTVMQIETGRVVKIAPVKDDTGQGILKSRFIYNVNGKDITIAVSLLRMSDDDHDILEEGAFESFGKLMSETLFVPLSKWFAEHLIYINTHKN